MCHSPHPGDSLWLYCHEWDVANMNMLHERGTLYYPAIISQITETHNTAHNYIRPDTIISTPICFTGSQLRIFLFCLVLIHLVWAFEIEFENYLHVVDTIGQWSMDEWTLPAAVSRVFRRDYDSFKSRLGPLPVIRPQVVLVRSTVSPPPIQLGQTSKHNQLQYSIGLQIQTVANK